MTENERELKEYEDIPQTVIGHSCLLTKFSIFLRGSGLKEVVKKMRDGEDLRLTVSHEGVSTFEVVDTHDKYSKRKE